MPYHSSSSPFNPHTLCTDASFFLYFRLFKYCISKKLGFQTTFVVQKSEIDFTPPYFSCVTVKCAEYQLSSDTLFAYVLLLGLVCMRFSILPIMPLVPGYPCSVPGYPWSVPLNLGSVPARPKSVPGCP